jgi:hypothetical protein
MSVPQHDRIKALAAELRLNALPDIYGAIAQEPRRRRTPAMPTSWRTSCAPSAMRGVCGRV